MTANWPPPWARLQTNKWSCGPAALRHALAYHGIKASVERIAELAGIDKDFDADTTPGLAGAALEYACQMQHVVRNNAALAQAVLEIWGPPVLMCVDRWNHWICIVGVTARAVYYLDSERPGPVARREVWREFLPRAMKWHRSEERYDMYPVVKL